MPAPRSKLFAEICGLAGPAVNVIDPRDGWPGIALVHCFDGVRRVAMHVSRITTHARQPYERRFQNPADSRPAQAPPGATPIFVGLGESHGQPILVAVDASSRVGRHARFSILFNVAALQQAALSGWSEYRSNSGEQMFAMNPQLLPAYIEALAHQVLIDPLAVADAAAASGLADDPDDEQSAERTRSTVSRLVRRAGFGKDVCSAYGNLCAMCGISLSLTEGAHIYPASAPNSSDAVWNGLSLCRNHHRIFDLHRIWISPVNGTIRWHPDILQLAEADAIIANFVDNTRADIATPAVAVHRPRKAMFEQRYDFVGEPYDWVQ